MGNFPCAVSHALAQHERDIDAQDDRDSAVEREMQNLLTHGDCAPWRPENIADAVAAVLESELTDSTFETFSRLFVKYGEEGIGKALMHEVRSYCIEKAKPIAVKRVTELEHVGFEP